MYDIQLGFRCTERSDSRGKKKTPFLNLFSYFKSSREQSRLRPTRLLAEFILTLDAFCGAVHRLQRFIAEVNIFKIWNAKDYSRPFL